MTKQEASKTLVECEKAPDWKYTESMIREACQVLAGALEDKPAEQPLDAVELAKVAIAMIELEKYRDLGTVEELRRMAEKMRKNGPLPLEELRGMDGQAVWCEDEHCAGIISVDIGGKWAGVPFLIFRAQGVNCTYNIEERGLSIYRRKPEEVFA